MSVHRSSPPDQSPTNTEVQAWHRPSKLIESSRRQEARSRPRELINTKEVAELMGISTRTAYDYLAKGIIPGRKVGAKWYVHRAALVAYLSGATSL